jgi:hypothetical protein
MHHNPHRISWFGIRGALCLGMLLWVSIRSTVAGEVDPHALDVGVAGHAFDHLGDIGDQAEAAARSGSTIIYTTGFGWMYEGMKPQAEMARAKDGIAAYVRQAKREGIRLAIGYVCATSIVGLDRFDRYWAGEFRAKFSSGPAAWLQQDANGKPLPSWYGGEYRPACMNNPDWRAYEKYVVRLQLEAGMDGIFFDNPTVHPQGCYCDHCMRKFAAYLQAEGINVGLRDDAPASEWRKVAKDRAVDFLRFRATIAADFLADMRAYARTIKPGALVTCNNSLNSPDVLFRQCRTYGYNIDALSRVEDLVVVEDMASQPRVLPNGSVVEYGPVYEVLRAVSHGKPVVAITVAEADYHTPPDLTRLAMAEAAAHGASYLLWPTWPAAQRQRMIDAVRPEADLLRRNADKLQNASGRADVAVFLPFDEWVATPDCRAMRLAQALSPGNVQFEVISSDELREGKLDPKNTPALLLESTDAASGAERAAIDAFRARGGTVVSGDGSDWLEAVRRAIKHPSAIVQGPGTLRVVVRDQPARTVVHVLNLNVKRISSFEDAVTPAEDVRLAIRVPRDSVRSVRAISADAGATQGNVPYRVNPDGGTASVEIRLGRVVLSTMIIID